MKQVRASETEQNRVGMESMRALKTTEETVKRKEQNWVLCTLYFVDLGRYADMKKKQEEMNKETEELGRCVNGV